MYRFCKYAPTDILAKKIKGHSYYGYGFNIEFVDENDNNLGTVTNIQRDLGWALMKYYIITRAIEKSDSDFIELKIAGKVKKVFKQFIKLFTDDEHKNKADNAINKLVNELNEEGNTKNDVIEIIKNYMEYSYPVYLKN